MKKSLYTLMTLVTLSAMAAPMTTFAAEEEGGSTPPAGNIEYKSNGQITFEQDDKPTPPVDPEEPDPENPVDPEDPTDPEGPNPGTEGPLSIDFASSFQFGSQKITSANETYFAELQKFNNAEGKLDHEGPNYVQVTDKRGTFEGWKLSVKQNGQFQTADGKKLDGAKLAFANANAVLGSKVEEGQEINFTPGTVEQTVTLDPEGTKADLVVAAKDQGMGTWLYRFGTSEVDGKEAVSLEVPGSTPKMAKQYSTTLTWSLESTPAN